MRVSPIRVLVLALTVLAPLRASGAAKPYPTVTCVSAKQKAAGKYCRAVLAAWARWERGRDDTKRDAAIAEASSDLTAAWQRAESKSTGKGVDCAQATLTDAEAASHVDSAAGAFVDLVNAGLDATNAKQQRCGGKIVKAAAARCAAILAAESRFVLGPGKKSAATIQAKLAHARDDATADFAKAFGKATASDCPTTATAQSAGDAVDAVADGLARDTTMSPKVTATGFDVLPGTPVTYGGKQLTPVCMDGSPYAFFAKRGTVNKLLFYFQGGGACWETLTCSLPACDTNVNPNGNDNPANAASGFFDLSNPANPFRDWNIVFVSYCSCDIHFGDAAQDYPPHVEHRGYQNSRAVEKWAREHFAAPEEIFVTGSSAGAYGAWFNAPLLMEVWPGATFDVLADAGNGVITQSFLDQNFPNWNFRANLPADIPDIQKVLDDGSGIPGYTEVVAKRFPNANWAHYASAYDGSFGGQSSFYAIMLDDNNPVAALSWWTATCQFNAKMRAQVTATAAALPANYRYYIGSGARHTMWYSNKVYHNTLGGVPTLVDWVSAMITGAPGSEPAAWSNVECTNCGRLLPGEDVGLPNPLVPPFVQQGPDVVIQCPAS